MLPASPTAVKACAALLQVEAQQPEVMHSFTCSYSCVTCRPTAVGDRRRDT